MTIQDWGAIGEVVGALGVLVTLVYLAHQIRQNTRQIEQNTRTAKAGVIGASAHSLRQTRQALYENPETSELFVKGMRDPSELDDVSLLRFRLILQSITESIWDVHSQTAATDLSPETWQTVGVSLVERILSAPGGRWYWTEYGATYPAAFRSVVDEILSAESEPLSALMTRPDRERDLAEDES